jgi:hypothetical protein
MALFIGETYDFWYYIYDPDPILNLNLEDIGDTSTLYDALSEVGCAMLGVEDHGGYESVEWARSEVEGYGPTLYIVAMQEATKRGVGLTSDDDGETSEEAQSVWDHFERDSQKAGSGIIKAPSASAAFMVSRQIVDVSTEIKNNNKVVEFLRQQFTLEEITDTFNDVTERFY